MDSAWIKQLVLRELSKKRIQAADVRVLIERHLHEAGDVVKLGLQSITMPFLGKCAFMDLTPQANWAIPVVYLLVPDDNKDVAVAFDETFPPPNQNDWEFLDLE